MYLTWNVNNQMDTPCIPRFAWAISRNWRGGLLPLLFAKWIFLIGKQQKKRGLLHPPPLQIGEKYFLKEHPYFNPLAGPTMTTITLDFGMIWKLRKKSQTVNNRMSITMAEISISIELKYFGSDFLNILWCIFFQENQYFCLRLFA